MVRAATSEELVQLRSDGQKTDLFLTLDKPAIVYTARVNQTTFSDPMAQVTYDGGSGTLANVKNGMTLYIGSTAGAYDLGMTRIRKTPSATVFYINESSEVPWANDLYLTVVDEFGLWQKHLVMAGTLVLMDYDIAYTDQHQYLAPVPVMGPPAVLWLTGATVDLMPDSTDSWVLGSTITAYLWAAPGSSTTSGLDSATPTITYNAAGRYRISCTVTAANGKTTTGYRYVYVYDSSNLPAINFELLSCSGDRDSGGWEFSVRMYAEAGLSDVRDRAMVILSAKDWYGITEGSIGSNIVAMGWISGETIHLDPEDNSVTFEVKGPQYWLDQIPGYPVGVEYKGTNPTVWTSLLNLTVDKGLWHLLHWRSTATTMMDILLTGDTQYLPTAETGSGSLWAQLTTISEQTIIAKPVCDAFGRLIIQVDTQYLAVADRSGIPEIMTLTQDDLMEAIDFERNTVPEVSQVYATGISYDGSKATPLLSKAPGTALSRFGNSLEIDQLLISSQARLNELSGMIYAKENNPYKAVDILLSQNNRLLDIAERANLILSIGATDTVRGIVLINQKFLIRRINYEYYAEEGYLLTELTVEAETVGVSGVTIPYVKPKQIGTIGNLPEFELDTDTYLPIFTGLPGFPSTNFFQPEEVPDTDDDLIDGTEADCPTDAPANGPYQAIGGITLTDQYNHYYADGYISKVIRTTAHANRTKYVITGRFQKLVGGYWVDAPDDAWYNLYAYGANGQVVATGSHDAVVGTQMRSGYLDAASATEIYALRLMIEPTLAEPASVVIESGSGLIGYPCTPGTYAYSRFGAGYTVRTTSMYTFIGSGDNYGVLSLEVPSTPVAEVTVIGVGYGYNLTQVAIGSFLNNNFQEWDYTQSVSGNYALYVKTFAATRGRFSFRVLWSNNSTHSYQMHAEFRVQPLPTYRILLSGVNLYNVCPREVSA